jgi:hypothetical protein
MLSAEFHTARELEAQCLTLAERVQDPGLLAPVSGWFTEGFDTADLRETKTLLAALP